MGPRVGVARREQHSRYRKTENKTEMHARRCAVSVESPHHNLPCHENWARHDASRTLSVNRRIGRTCLSFESALMGPQDIVRPVGNRAPCVPNARLMRRLAGGISAKWTRHT